LSLTAQNEKLFKINYQNSRLNLKIHLKSLLKEGPYLTIIGSLIIFVGMLCSRALMSIGMILILLDAVWTYSQNRSVSGGNHWVFLSLILIFFIYLIGGIHTEDWSFYLERLRLKLPFLLLPIAFLFIKPLQSKTYFFLLFSFLVLVSLGSVYCLSDYLLHFTERNENYLKGHVLVTPVNHIRFSLMTAYAALIGFYLYRKWLALNLKFWAFFALFLGAFLLVFLHVLAVRSGLLAFYLAGFCMLIYDVYTQKRWLRGFSIFLLFISLPIAAYYTFPTLQQKVSYMRYDLNNFFYQQEKRQLSDSRRILSWQVGIQVAAEQPLVGIGIGDVKKKVFEIYENDYSDQPKTEWMLPHNQFIFVYAGLGLFGVVLFLVAILSPFLYKAYFLRDELFLAFNVIVWSSFLSESTLETQLGVCFYSIFLLLALAYLKNRK